ncbi:MAG: PAS domain-containing protein [Rhodobacteraceae bacterium]|nr:PAS domain-containing protein [Paracoccaceae bacterium]MCF8513989.1 PAS domain-containing protein [Paracoccaceae bacterium]MCF8518233.1 PAS domain-containing protein [Paracoccaceae bacterium]
MEAITKAMLTGLPLPAVIIGVDEKLRAMNAQAERFLGPAAMDRHHAMTLRQPEVQAALTSALREGRAGQARHVVQGPSQDSVYRMTATPLPGGAGVLCVFEDLSEAEQMGQMRREFVANVSHELRSPLTAVLGFIETLKGAAKDDPVARDRFLTIMEREAGRMNRLIHDLLHLSRVEADERVRPTERVDVNEIVQSTMTSLRPLAQASGVEVILDSAEGLGPKAWVVQGDADQLVQVFQNLIENAVKYGGSGGPVIVRMTPDQLPKSAAVRVEVIDRGPGIDPLHIPRLTERFYRVDGHRSREKGGTGLGLAIVKHIVQRHRGRLSIDSAPGTGSTFCVILPKE